LRRSYSLGQLFPEVVVGTKRQRRVSRQISQKDADFEFQIGEIGGSPLPLFVSLCLGGKKSAWDWPTHQFEILAKREPRRAGVRSQGDLGIEVLNQRAGAHRELQIGAKLDPAQGSPLGSTRPTS